MDFGAGTAFVAGQSFGAGQSFDQAMDFSGGAMTFDQDTQFQAVQGFDQAGAFSQGFVLPERTIANATTEWADVFDDLGIESITGYDKATGLVAQNYETGIIYQDFIGTVTSGVF